MNKSLLEKTKRFLLKKFNLIPQIAIITGSGIRIFRDKDLITKIKYNRLSIWKKKISAPNIKGHEGTIKLYKIKTKNIVVFSGRHHLYEGYNIEGVVANIRLSYDLGIKKIIMTNAAGGIKKNFRVGDLMLISGFLDLMQSTERGILSGIVQPLKIIKSKLTKLISKQFKREIKPGIYAGVLGPSYETYSEIKLLQSLDAHAVGMSTVGEIICAKSLGIDFAGISIISNVWSQKHKPSHKEVLKNVDKANKKLENLILKLLDYI